MIAFGDFPKNIFKFLPYVFFEPHCHCFSQHLLANITNLRKDHDRFLIKTLFPHLRASEAYAALRRHDREIYHPTHGDFWIYQRHWDWCEDDRELRARLNNVNSINRKVRSSLSSGLRSDFELEQEVSGNRSKYCAFAKKSNRVECPDYDTYLRQRRRKQKRILGHASTTQ